MKVKVYRKFVNTSSRLRVLLRPMADGDQTAVSEMFCRQASDNDVRFLKDDVRDPELVAAWFAHLDYERVVPLLALHGDRLVGDATLHRRQGSGRHIGELRIFLTKEFRGVGLGMQMLKELIDIGREMGLHMLVAEVVSDELAVIKAFRKLGFVRHAEFDDYFMDAAGGLHDVSIMVLSLAGRKEYLF
ncbi:MAG: GNAT family N-acetyltransferase [Deltaproteobacteria bacterium]|nr:GNAT family N-acetyltransferase [Deltaproteobacteria bacterium]